MNVLCGQNGQIGQNVPCPVVVGHNNVFATVFFQNWMSFSVMGTRKRFEPATQSLVLCGLSGQNGHLALHLVGVERNWKQENVFCQKVLDLKDCNYCVLEREKCSLIAMNHLVLYLVNLFKKPTYPKDGFK
jgi:hypothetical protein